MNIKEHSKTPWLVIRPRWLPISFRVDKRVPLVVMAMLTVTIVALVLSISYGDYHIAPLDVVRTLLNINQSAPDYTNFSSALRWRPLAR